MLIATGVPRLRRGVLEWRGGGGEGGLRLLSVAKLELHGWMSRIALHSHACIGIRAAQSAEFNGSEKGF